MLSRILWQGWSAWRGLHRYWTEIEACARESESVARARLAARLQAQIRYFGSRPDALPEWRAAARIADPLELWRCWPALPIVTKQDLRERFAPERIQRDLGVAGRRSTTGGSTGEPTAYLHDAGMLAATTATRMYARQAMGWRPGMATVCVWGSERDIGGQRRSRRARATAALRREYLVDGYRLDRDTVERALELIVRHRPVALYGFTSMLEFVARSVLERGDAPPPGSVRVAWNGGENLSEQQRELFRQAFGVPILNLYGGRELSVIGFEARAGSALRIVRPLVFLEIVGPDGRPAAPGEPGRVLCTSTVCRGTPFLRYEIGDLASYAAADCDLSGIRALEQICGRTAGVIPLPGGRVLQDLFWNHLLKDYPEVHQFQVVLHSPSALTLRLKGRPLVPARENQLRGVLAGALGGEMAFDLEWREKLPLTAQGKLLQVVRAGQVSGYPDAVRQDDPAGHGQVPGCSDAVHQEDPSQHAQVPG